MASLADLACSVQKQLNVAATPFEELRRVDPGATEATPEPLTRSLGVTLPPGYPRRNVSGQLRRALRETVVSGRIGWAEIDTLSVRYDFED